MSGRIDAAPRSVWKGEGIPMLISGLWKLAAMAGVIGVGLVAVYQAQQGLVQPPSSVATSEEKGDTNALSAASDSSDLATASATPSNESSLELANPFADSATRTASTSDAPPAETDNSTDPFERNGSGTPASTTNLDSPDDSGSGPTAAPTTVSGPGLDFRDEPLNSGPSLGGASSNATVQQTGFEDSPPARLPEEADPFADSAAPAAVSEQQPFVRGASETKPAPTASRAVPVADPFDTASSPELTATPPAEEPDAAPASKVATPEADPFANGPDDPTTPARSEPEFDPFGGSSPRTSPDESSAPSLGKPGTNANRSKPAAAADPFGDPSAAPPALAPTDVPVEITPREPVETIANPPTARDRRVLPRLPTEVPSPTEAIDEPGPSRRQRDPLSNRLPPDEPSSPTESAQPSPHDLIGDGTVTDANPRGIQQPRLTIEKIAPTQAVLGEPLVYSVIIKNVGGSEAHHVVVEDRIPKGTELTGTAPRAEMVDKKLIWRIGTMKPNEEKKISIRVIPRQEGPIGSVARVNFAAEVAAEIVVAAPQLSLKVNAPREVRVGETFDLTFLLKNSGGAAANNVSVRDLVPDGLKHEAAADIECPIGRLGPNESREIVLQVTAVKPGRVKNRAILSADGGISQDLESAIDIIGEHLVLTRTGQNRIYAERPAIFTNNVKNEGNAAVNRVKVSEIVPAGLEFVEASDGGRFDPVERAIHWTVGPLAPGEESTVSAKLIAKTPGNQLGKIIATGSAGSAASVKSEVDVVGRPELQMETLNATGQVAVGDKLTSKIQLKNSGSAPAHNVGLSISIPREMKLIEVRGARYQAKNNVVVFEPLAELAPRGAATFEVVMEATAEADAKMDLQITADHLTKPARRTETVQIATEVR